MSKHKVNATQTDKSNPEWTDKMFKQATTLDDASLPEAFKDAARKGRPPKANPKKPISIRLSPDVLEYFRSTGKGWQTKVDKVLKEYMDSH